MLRTDGDRLVRACRLTPYSRTEYEACASRPADLDPVPGPGEHPHREPGRPRGLPHGRPLRPWRLVRDRRRLVPHGGPYGQLCFVCPPQEAVVTITAHVETGSPRANITALIRQEILDRL